MVALVAEFTLLPVRLEVAHLGTVLVPVGVVEGVFEAALAALPDAVEDKSGDTNSTNGTSTDTNTSLGAGRQFIPLFGEGLRWRLVQFGDSGRVAPDDKLASCI